MNETPDEATSQPISPQYPPVFPGRRLIVLLAILVLLVMLIIITFFSFASQEVPGPWSSGEHFSEHGKDEVSSGDGTVE
jgi:hypothetical protein